jgi:hypothetical protein
VTVANEEKKMKILGYSSINLFSKKISNVLYIQNCSSNLLSIRKIVNELNYEILFTPKKHNISRMYNKEGDW